jgi:hypothetical protein
MGVNLQTFRTDVAATTAAYTSDWHIGGLLHYKDWNNNLSPLNLHAFIN